MKRNDPAPRPVASTPAQRGPRRAAAEAPGAPGPGALLENLATHQALLRELVQMAQRKLDAVRSADADALNECAARESGLLERLVGVERQRRAELARLAQIVPALRGTRAARLTLSELAEALDEPHASSIRARLSALRSIATQLQRANRVASLVARDLHAHLREVFAAMARAGRASVVYGPNGSMERAGGGELWDAVG